MEKFDFCKNCLEKKFGTNGVGLARGIQFFKCFNCGESSANYVDGQTLLCHECSRKLGKCVMCGGPIK